MDPQFIPGPGNRSTPPHPAEDQGNILTEEGQQDKNPSPSLQPERKRRRPTDQASEAETVEVVDNSDLRDRLKSVPKGRGARLDVGRDTQTWPRVLVIEAEDPERPLAKLSFWAVEKAFEGFSPHLKITNLDDRKGVYEVECPTEAISRNTLARNGTVFVDRTIKVTPHRSKNSCRGVIYCRDLDHTSVEETEENLKSQGVTKVHRVSRGSSEPKELTHTYFLTFGLPNIPDKINIGRLKVRVAPFIQKPQQCFNCLKFGHPASKCKGKMMCRRCGYDAHEGSCPHPPKCVNCKGNHAPTSKKCEVYLKEAHIKKVQCENKISFKEAKKRVEAATPTTHSHKTFAEAASSASTTDKLRPAPKTFRGKQVQFPVDPIEQLPEEIHAEALALARSLRDSLKKKIAIKKTKDASSQFASGAISKKANQASKPNRQAPKPAPSSSQAKPGASPAPPPKAAGDKQPPKSAPPTSGTRSEPPASAPQATGGEQASNPSEQAQGPRTLSETAPTQQSPKASPEKASAHAPQVAEMEQPMEHAVSTSSDSEPEETPETASQAAGGCVEIVSPKKGELGMSGSALSPFLALLSPKKVKKKRRKKAEQNPILQSLNRSPYEDPEEMEDEANNYRSPFDFPEEDGDSKWS